MITPSRENLALLKLKLIAHGIHEAVGLPSPLANPFGLVHLVLPEQVPVSVHLAKPHHKTPFTLTCDGSLNQARKFFLETSGAAKIRVQWTSPLKCYAKKTASGILVSDILTVHGNFIAVHPAHPCRFGQSGLSCRYCGSTRELSQHPPFSKRDLIEAIHIVLKEKPCDVVHLSSGHVESEDGGVEWLIPWVAEIRKHLNILIALDLAPPKNNDWIDRTYAMGVDALYYDTDFFDPRGEPVKTLQEKKRRQLEALEYAARIFPAGAVLSHLVIGFEPPEETGKTIDLLIERGVVPVLAYFPPAEDTELKTRWTATPEKITGLYAHLFEGLVRAGITPHWVQQFDVVLTPLEARFLSSKSPRYHLALKNFYQTALGRTVRLGLASLRRHLRVREVPQ